MIISRFTSPASVRAAYEKNAAAGKHIKNHWILFALTDMNPCENGKKKNGKKGVKTAERLQSTEGTTLESDPHTSDQQPNLPQTLMNLIRFIIIVSPPFILHDQQQQQ